MEMDLQSLRNKISSIFEEYFIEWVKTHRESNIIDYIEHNQRIKNELNKELNKFDNKIVLKEINKKIKK